MPLQQIEAIILKEEPSQENTRMVSLFTSELGLIKVKAMGKKWKSRLEKGAIIKGFIYHKRSFTLTECELAWIPTDIYKDLNLWCKAMLLLESTYKILLPNERNVQIYNLLKLALFYLNKKDRSADIVCLSYLIKLIRYVGYYPMLNHCQRCKHDSTPGYLSYTDGGYICRNCMVNGDLPLLSKNDFSTIANLNSINLKDIKPDTLVNPNLWKAVTRYLESIIENKLFSVNVMEQIKHELSGSHSKP